MLWCIIIHNKCLAFVRALQSRSVDDTELPEHIPESIEYSPEWTSRDFINTLRTGDADLRFYITTVQDG